MARLLAPELVRTGALACIQRAPIVEIHAVGKNDAFFCVRPEELRIVDHRLTGNDDTIGAGQRPADQGRDQALEQRIADDLGVPIDDQGDVIGQTQQYRGIVQRKRCVMDNDVGRSCTAHERRNITGRERRGKQRAQRRYGFDRYALYRVLTRRATTPCAQDRMADILVGACARLDMTAGIPPSMSGR